MNNSIRGFITQYSTQLKELSDTPRLDVELLIAHTLECPRSHLYAYPEQRLTDPQTKQLSACMALRIKGTPMAYILGRQEFYGLNFSVNKDVLIPRPDTELLVDLALDKMPDDQPIVAIDLGTGSGAIAIALAYHRPHWTIMATDQSDKALKVAQENARQYGLANLLFIRANWLHGFKAECADLIISNPPYLDQNDPHLLGSIRFEPQEALVAGCHGIADFQTIIQMSEDCLKPQGLLLLEHGLNQSESVQTSIQNNLTQWTTHCDIENRARALSAIKT